LISDFWVYLCLFYDSISLRIHSQKLKSSTLYLSVRDSYFWASQILKLFVHHHNQVMELIEAYLPMTWAISWKGAVVMLAHDKIGSLDSLDFTVCSKTKLCTGRWEKHNRIGQRKKSLTCREARKLVTFRKWYIKVGY